MNGPRIVAELRSWTKQDIDRPTYQGYVFNDITHKHRDGTFITLEADEVVENHDSALVYIQKDVYVLWEVFKNKKRNIHED